MSRHVGAIRILSQELLGFNNLLSLVSHNLQITNDYIQHMPNESASMNPSCACLLHPKSRNQGKGIEKMKDSQRIRILQVYELIVFGILFNEWCVRNHETVNILCPVWLLPSRLLRLTPRGISFSHLLIFGKCRDTRKIPFLY